ncbi:low affinity iron permease family protein [Mucilaginibacter ginkgonis]|uniref:Low affinity iron permease family protein n=1 Tax=Mucilaginibacter ginkgonis TaxID=2682091 RepID=A0A6I4I203_9SPHI|nr:low affinity iron permease family protein [Mucilaginibacter ginkgonis]QQL50790.1 low affinity iron permease family protein [Mucilaginibacter ginkgonis]
MSKESNGSLIERFANKATQATGSSAAFIIATAVIIIWCVSGPLFHYSDTWQLVINTGTTIITFLMVFLIQKSQNKDSKAVHLKLNELIAAQQGASNRIIDIEDLSEAEIEQIHKFYVRLGELAKKENDLGCTHTYDAAEDNHDSKVTRSQEQTSRINESANKRKKSN